MRMGKRMKQVLDVLGEAQTPLTLSEILVKILDGKVYAGTRCNKVASALVKSPMSDDSVSFTKIASKTKKQYHPMDYANVLYALYSRSVNRLWELDCVRCVGLGKANRRRWVLNVNKPSLNVNEVRVHP